MGYQVCDMIEAARLVGRARKVLEYLSQVGDHRIVIGGIVRCDTQDLEHCIHSGELRELTEKYHH